MRQNVRWWRKKLPSGRGILVPKLNRNVSSVLIKIKGPKDQGGLMIVLLAEMILGRIFPDATTKVISKENQDESQSRNKWTQGIFKDRNRTDHLDRTKCGRSSRSRVRPRTRAFSMVQGRLGRKEFP